MLQFDDKSFSNEHLKQQFPFMTLAKVHYLSGPIRVSDVDGVPAKPGDLLVVEICNLGPLPGDEWGYTATFDRENGGGFLTDHFPHATKAIWYFEGVYAYSPHIPGKFLSYLSTMCFSMNSKSQLVENFKYLALRNSCMFCCPFGY